MAPRPLAEHRVAIVTTAGLHRASDRAFSTVDLSYRVIPGELDASELTMTHSSVHFDRSGFREDVNLVFPIDRLRELAVEGLVGSVADFHYSLMGAGWPPTAIVSRIASRSCTSISDRRCSSATSTIP